VHLVKPLFAKQTYAELLYVGLGLPLGIAGFTFVVTSLSLSVGLAIILIGFPLLALSLVLARWFGAVERGLGRALLGVEVGTPRKQPRTRPILGFFTDRVGWRAMAFLFLRLPVSILDFTVSVTVWAYGLAGSTYWYWRHFLPVQHYHGVAHRGSQLGPGYFIDTAPRILVATVLGIIVLVASPWIVHGMLTLDRMLVRGLLGPTTAAERVRELETTRAMAVEDSAAELRRIERDLHDGAQARLVALAMSLGLAKEELEGDDPEVAIVRVRQLVDDAHREAKGTIVDLRDLARGIHPPALDRGLPDALATLTARCAIPVSLHVALEPRPTPAVETIVYFCTAELLTNVVKHSGARRASVSVIRGEHRLVLRVEDDGAGGAAAGRGGGSGLAGLADRVATVDGTLQIVSPEGGPTTMTVEIPL
jgi:signal transduction histidine kinase